MNQRDSSRVLRMLRTLQYESIAVCRRCLFVQTALSTGACAGPSILSDMQLLKLEPMCRLPRAAGGRCGQAGH